MKLHILTLTNKIEHKQYNVNELKKSLYPIDLLVIRDYDPNIKNLSKLFKTFDFLIKCNNINDKDVICIVDGHDVLFNKKKHNIHSMMETFLSYDTDIVFSVENKCSHHSDVAKKYLESLSSFANCYLNTGVIFAYKDKYVKFLTEVLSNIDSYRLPGSFSDQQIISIHLATVQPDNVKLDYNNRLALTLNTSTDVCCDDIKACFVHVTFLANSSQLLKYQKLLNYMYK
jgi:hypothetical protein